MKKTLAVGLLLLNACSHEAKIEGKGPNSWSYGKCPDESLSILNHSRQLLLVKTESWSSPKGQAEFYERPSDETAWELVREFEVVVGRNGLGWGKDFVRFAESDEPIKREGDGKGAAGIFSIGRRFGFESSLEPGHLELKDSTFCVDDVGSRYYNRIVNKEKVKADWKEGTGENMLEEPLYRKGFVINYSSSAEKKSGSCLFLHIWSRAGEGTSGCVAMSEADMSFLYYRVKSLNNPVLASFPETLFKNLSACLR